MITAIGARSELVGNGGSSVLRRLVISFFVHSVWLVCAKEGRVRGSIAPMGGADPGLMYSLGHERAAASLFSPKQVDKSRTHIRRHEEGI